MRRRPSPGTDNARNAKIAKKTTKSKNEYAGLKFLGIMFVVALVICGGIFAVTVVKDKLRSASADQTVAEPATVNVTFHEGKTVRQYGALLEENEVCSAEDFYNEMRVTDFTADYSFLPSNEILQQREYPLEGYLYPDTYTFYIGEKPKSVIKRFLRNFAVRVSDEMVNYANSNGEGFQKVDMSCPTRRIIIPMSSPMNVPRASAVNTTPTTLSDFPRGRYAALRLIRSELPSIPIPPARRTSSSTTNRATTIMQKPTPSTRRTFSTARITGLREAFIFNNQKDTSAGLPFTGTGRRV